MAGAPREWVDECPGRFDVKRELGNGYFATVYQAFDHELGQTVAVKAVDRRKLTTEYANISKINFEAQIMSELDHGYVCKLLDRTDTDLFILLILEFCPNGTLFNEIVSQSTRHLTKDESRRVFYQLVECVEYLHSMHCSHRDLKPENILFDKDMNVKVADFGLAFSFDPTQTTTESVGSLDYASPEVLLQYPYVGPEPDVWSMGVVLYAMLTGTLPFMGATDEDVFKAIVRGQFRIPRFLGEDVVEIIEACFTLDPHLRPSVSELKTFSFLWSVYGTEDEMPPRTSSVESSGGVSTPRERMGLIPSNMLTDDQVKTAHKKMIRTESIRGSMGAVLGAEPTPRERTPTPKRSAELEDIDIDIVESPRRRNKGSGLKLDATPPSKRKGSAPDPTSARMTTEIHSGGRTGSPGTGKASRSPSRASARPHSMHLTSVEVNKAITVQQAALGTDGTRSKKRHGKKAGGKHDRRGRRSSTAAGAEEKKSRRRTISFGKVSPLATLQDIRKFDEEEARRRQQERKNDPSYHKSLRKRVLSRKKKSSKGKRHNKSGPTSDHSLTPKQRKKKERKERKEKERLKGKREKEEKKRERVEKKKKKEFGKDEKELHRKGKHNGKNGSEGSGRRDSRGGRQALSDDRHATLRSGAGGSARRKIIGSDEKHKTTRRKASIGSGRDRRARKDK